MKYIIYINLFISIILKKFIKNSIIYFLTYQVFSKDFSMIFVKDICLESFYFCKIQN